MAYVLPLIMLFFKRGRKNLWSFYGLNFYLLQQL
jgi:hypothetical protein